MTRNNPKPRLEPPPKIIVEMPTTCSWCRESLSPTRSKMYVELNGNGHASKVLHMQCFNRQKATLKRTRKKVSNPVGRYGAKNGG